MAVLTVTGGKTRESRVLTPMRRITGLRKMAGTM